MYQPPLPPPIPFTQEGYQKVVTEIEQLEEQRKEVLIRLQAAREMGDLSENGAYKAARWELGGIDRRLRELNRLKLLGRVVEPQTNGVVEFGGQVKVKNEAGEEISFTLVNKYESDPTARKLSIDSPIGSALMGKKVGDKVLVNTPSGAQEFQVLEI